MSIFKNRTVIGVICILLALVICFGITPLFNQSISQKAEIVRISFPDEVIPSPYPGSWPDAGELRVGDEFSLAWRCLDAQYWGVAQRRKRIFLLTDFAGLLAPQLLFDVFGEEENCEEEVI